MGQRTEISSIGFQTERTIWFRSYQCAAGLELRGAERSSRSENQ